ncbi:MAG TPA: 4a-hydroxytetrahydrobiopterin dehydratase [archaeon]|nr:4a-hydroxytetrahydrobiopterin dehydratase [archaeon]
MPELSEKKCVPCSIGASPLSAKEAKKFLLEITGWELIENAKKIRKEFKFVDFMEAMNFVNSIAAVAESEGHHPDFSVSYNKVIVTIFTHKIGGLHENDFILAAKIDKIRK